MTKDFFLQAKQQEKTTDLDSFLFCLFFDISCFLPCPSISFNLCQSFDFLHLFPLYFYSCYIVLLFHLFNHFFSLFLIFALFFILSLLHFSNFLIFSKPPLFSFPWYFSLLSFHIFIPWQPFLSSPNSLTYYSL